VDTPQVKQAALSLGFDAVGITTADPITGDHANRFAQWLADGCHASMRYLARRPHARFDPRHLLADARSVVCVALAYKPPPLPDRPTHGGPWGRVAVYGLYDDYHTFIRKRLQRLGRTIGDRSVHRFRVCVDTAPLAERALAQRAGLGHIGRNRLLIHPRFGPHVFLGELITTTELEPDPPSQSGARSDPPICGDCRACIDACPTGALDPSGRLDARRCLSYLTGEYDGPIDASIARRMGDTLYRCERCIDACPYAQHAPARPPGDFAFHPERRWLSLPHVLQWTPDDFDRTFARSAATWTGLHRLQRNARCCLAARNPPRPPDRAPRPL